MSDLLLVKNRKATPCASIENRFKFGRVGVSNYEGEMAPKAVERLISAMEMARSEAGGLRGLQ
jgi:hypothetical protein